MIGKFNLWSDLNPEAAETLHPDLGLRDWDDLTCTEKEKIWFYLERYFTRNNSAERIPLAIYILNEKHKYRSYAETFLRERSNANAMRDFQGIIINERKNKHVVLELISCFSRAILIERLDHSISQKEDETDEQYEERLTKWKYEDFDEFAYRLNDVFGHFGVNVVLTRHGFIPKQDKKIVKEIYEPVLKSLSNEKWKPVSRDLQDAFKDFQSKTKSGYSSCVTHAVSAIEAFLQILLYGETGKGTLKTLIPNAQKKGLIPKDKFTDQIFKNMEAIFARERKETGDAHPKKEYANEKNSLMVLNLTMVFLQHCMY